MSRGILAQRSRSNAESWILVFCFLCVPQRPQRETNIVVSAPASMLWLRLRRFVLLTSDFVQCHEEFSRRGRGVTQSLGFRFWLPLRSSASSVRNQYRGVGPCIYVVVAAPPLCDLLFSLPICHLGFQTPLTSHFSPLTCCPVTALSAFHPGRTPPAVPSVTREIVPALFLSDARLRGLRAISWRRPLQTAP